MIEYVIGINKNDCGSCLTTRTNWENEPLYNDEHNEVHSFVARTWDEAKVIYEAFLKKKGLR